MTTIRPCLSYPRFPFPAVKRPPHFLITMSFIIRNQFLGFWIKVLLGLDFLQIEVLFAPRVGTVGFADDIRDHPNQITNLSAVIRIRLRRQLALIAESTIRNVRHETGFLCGYYGFIYICVVDLKSGGNKKGRVKHGLLNLEGGELRGLDLFAANQPDPDPANRGPPRPEPEPR